VGGFSLYQRKLSELWLVHNPKPHVEVHLNNQIFYPLHLKTLGVDGRIILKRILKKLDERAPLNTVINLRFPLNIGGFLAWLMNCQRVKMESVSWS